MNFLSNIKSFPQSRNILISVAVALVASIIVSSITRYRSQQQIKQAQNQSQNPSNGSDVQNVQTQDVQGSTTQYRGNSALTAFLWTFFFVVLSVYILLYFISKPAQKTVKSTITDSKVPIDTPVGDVDVKPPQSGGGGGTDQLVDIEVVMRNVRGGAPDF